MIFTYVAEFSNRKTHQRRLNDERSVMNRIQNKMEMRAIPYATTL